MATRRLSTIGLALALLLAALPAAPITTAGQDRDVYDAAAFKLAAEVIVAAQGKKSGTTWKGLDKTTQAIIERRIQRIKDEREALAKEVRATLARHGGKDQQCERDAMERAWKDSDARLEHYLKRLRHTRGDKRSEGTRIWRSFQHNALKPLEKLANRSLPESPIELIGLYLSGGSAAVIESVKRKAVRVIREDLLMRVATGRGGRSAATSDESLQKACGERAEARPTTPAGVAASAGASYVCPLDCEHCAMLPPYDEPAFLIDMDWTNQADVRLNYWLAEPGSQAYSGAYWSGGCVDGPPPRHCSPVEPLVLTEASVGGKNLWYFPGPLELTVEAVPCVFADDIDKKDLSREGPRHRAVCKRVSQVSVTATTMFFGPGDDVGVTVGGPISVSVPLYPCEGAPDPGPYRRTIEALEWDPETGITYTDGRPEPAAGGSDEDAPWDVEPAPEANVDEGESE